MELRHLRADSGSVSSILSASSSAPAFGVILWFLVLQSGVHATLAGVIIALAIPLGSKESRPGLAPLVKLEHRLHPWVTFLIIPIFGFANAGVSFAGMEISDLGDPVPLGVALGLFLGKQVGVFFFSWIAIRLRIAPMPPNVGWGQLYGLSVLCGIGFTMSLFIGLLAYDSPSLQNGTKLGVILGSVISASAGAVLLLIFKNKTDGEEETE